MDDYDKTQALSDAIRGLLVGNSPLVIGQGLILGPKVYRLVKAIDALIDAKIEEAEHRRKINGGQREF